ncbi:MAG: O-antigen ligase family protein [Lutibacter sp.]
MNVNSTYIRVFLAIIHLVIGVLVLSPIFTLFYSSLIVAFGILFIIRSKNKNNEAILWSAYLVGAEVLFRMAGGMFFYELPKYSVLLFLIIGLIVEQKKHHISITYLVYILLLLIGIAFSNIPFNESIRKAIAFNLSGPILLGISAIYFYKRTLDVKTLLAMLFYMVLPILSMLSLLYFKTPDLKSIAFGTESNFEASGGFGPNQVSTILGVGIFIFVVHFYFKRRIFYWLFIDVLFFMYLIFRGLITFSRGGVITALLAVLIFTFYYSKSSKYYIKNSIRNLGLIVLVGIALWVYASNITGGMLTNRYLNENKIGVTKKDVSAGRADIFKSELNEFIEHPFFGIGVGSGKFYREDKLKRVVASHNEISRLLGEHGMLGLIALFLLIIVPLKIFVKESFMIKAFTGAFFVFWFLTINHSAMRIAFPGFIYGLSLININFNENSIYRQ